MSKLIALAVMSAAGIALAGGTVATPAQSASVSSRTQEPTPTPSPSSSATPSDDAQATERARWICLEDSGSNFTEIGCISESGRSSIEATYYDKDDQLHIDDDHDNDLPATALIRITLENGVTTIKKKKGGGWHPMRLAESSRVQVKICTSDPDYHPNAVCSGYSPGTDA